MPLDVDKLLSLPPVESRRRFDRADARRYALSIGFGSNPLDEADLDFVVDRQGFRTVPTMAAIFADVILELTHACNLQRPELALHGEQRLELLSPLSDSGSLKISGSIPHIYDRGEKRGAEIHMLAEARDSDSKALIYRATYVTIARGDGGFGGPEAVRRAAQHDIPDRKADATWDYRTRRDQALLYALNGDPNPIHTEPKIARSAGFELPILHGLCTYGIACRAVLETCCNFDPQRMKTFDVRFSAPVYPGEKLIVQMWQRADGIAFDATAEERDKKVLKGGFCKLAT